MRSIMTILTCLLTGCLLQSEPCGLDFKAVDGQCVPLQAPPPFTSDPDTPPDASTDAADARDLGLRLEPVFDASIVDVESDSTVEEDEWSAYSVVLLVDRSPDDSANGTPAIPGADIDAVEILAMDDRSFGSANDVIDARINDPYEANIQMEPRSALGLPDGRAVSLGTQGGFLRLALTTQGPITATARLRVVELEEDAPNEDAFEVFLCRSDSEGLSGCRSLGTVDGGTQIFELN